MALYVHKTLHAPSYVYDQDIEKDTFKEIRFRPKRNADGNVHGCFSTEDKRQIEFIESTDDFKRGFIQKAEGDFADAVTGRDSFVKCPFCATPCRTALDLAKHCTEKHSPAKESHGELHPATEGSQRQNTQASVKR